jgi:hypothetical protein
MRGSTREPFKIEHRRKNSADWNLATDSHSTARQKRFDGCTGSNTHRQKFGIEIDGLSFHPIVSEAAQFLQRPKEFGSVE